MADDQEKLNEREILRSLNYLGFPSTILQSAQGDVSAMGQGPAPAPAAGGKGGAVTGEGIRGPVGKTGTESNILGGLQKLLGKIPKDELMKLFQRSDTGSTDTGSLGTATPAEREAFLKGITEQGLSPEGFTLGGAGGLTKEAIEGLVLNTPLGAGGDVAGAFEGLSSKELQPFLQALTTGQEGATTLGTEGFKLGADTTLSTSGALGSTFTEALGAVAPFAGAAVDIIQGAMSGKVPASQQAIDAALDTAAAAAVASGVGAWVAPALLAAKQETANVMRLAGGNEPSTERTAFDVLEMTPTGMGITGLALDTLLGMFGTDVTSLFGGQGSYVPKRQAAGTEATQELGTLGKTFQDSAQTFAQTGDVAAPLAALQTQFGSRNPVRSELLVPADVAKQIGLDPSQGSPWGESFRFQWDQLKPEQFTKLLTAWQQNPDAANSWLLGSGDVAYLPQAQAEQVAASAKGEAGQFLNFLASHYASPQAQGTPQMTAGQLAVNPTQAPGAGAEGMGAQLTKEQLETLMSQVAPG